MDRSNEISTNSIGGAIGQVLEVDGGRGRRSRYLPFIHIKALFDSSKPLPAGYMLLRENLAPVKVIFKYERLGILL